MNEKIYNLKEKIEREEGKIKFFIIIFLLSFLAFGFGYLAAQYQMREPLQIENFIN